MSTRRNIIVKDQHSELIFYRHWDGYPEGALPLLEKFIKLVKDKKIRDNVGQAAGWLIVLGRAEDAKMLDKFDPAYREPWNDPNNMGWKVGPIEPTDAIHCDIEYLYVVDLNNKKIEHAKVGYNSSGPLIPDSLYTGQFRK